MTTGTRPLAYPWDVLDFPTFTDDRGSLTMAQGGPHGLVPFDIKRVYWLHDLALGAERGSHATFNTNQVLIPAVGGCTVKLSDGNVHREVLLQHRSHHVNVMGLWLKGGAWRELVDFEAGTVIMVLSDTHYEDADYVRDWNQYLKRMGRA